MTLAGILILAIGVTSTRGASALGPAPQRPLRIASLNLCADELVLRLLDRDRIVSVTFLAADPAASNVADLARGVPLNRGLAEEIIPLKPDLVITGAFTTQAATAMLRLFGVPVLELSIPETLDQAYEQIRQVAARVGEAERGERLIAAMKAGLAGLADPQGPKRTAIVLRPNGFTAGKGSLVDDLMSRAGLVNLAARLPRDKFGQLALEEVVVAHPDLLIVDSGRDAPPSLAQALLKHPALAALDRDGHILSVPGRFMGCPGPELVTAARRLAGLPDEPAPKAQASP